MTKRRPRNAPANHDCWYCVSLCRALRCVTSGLQRCQVPGAQVPIPRLKAEHAGNVLLRCRLTVDRAAPPERGPVFLGATIGLDAAAPTAQPVGLQQEVV